MTYLRIAVAAGLALTASAPATLAAAQPARPVVIVASPSGSGTVCDRTQPCSLVAAQHEARERIPVAHSDVEVVLDGGTYPLTSPLTLTEADSGRDGHRVVYAAAPGARPVLSGGHRLTGWQRVRGSAATWAADIPAGFDTHQLYLDGRRLPIAAGLPAGVRFVQTPTGFLATSPVVSTWPHPSNVAVVFTGGNGPWTQTWCNIASARSLIVTMTEPCWGNLHLNGEGVQELSWFDDPMGGFGGLSPATSPTFFQNACALLTPGHWCIDRVAHVVYYRAQPRQDVAAGEFVVPVLQTLVKVSGSLDRPAHDITLHGLTFAYGTWTGADGGDGFAQMQADWRLTGPRASKSEGSCGYSSPKGTCPFASWTRTPANVVLSATRNVEVTGNVFTHLGGAGLDIEYGSQRDLVQGNEFTDVAASAIQLGSTNDPTPAAVGAGPAELVLGNRIVDNYIHAVADQYPGGVGIWVGYTKNTLVAHNQIDDVPYTAISMGWGGWHTTVLDPGSDPNINANNVISDNLLFNYMSLLGDGGAVYTNGSQATSWASALRISGNVAYRGTNTDFSIYTDAASQYVEITGNLVYDQPFDSFASGGCRTVGHIRLTGNYFAQGGPAYPCFLYTDVASSRNTTICENPPPDQVPTAPLESAGLEPAFRSLLASAGPTVVLVGPTHLATQGGRVLISGSGFTPSAKVSFAGMPARSVRVLSGNYIVATSPPGQGTVDVTVTTRYGTSSRTAADRVSFERIPLGCIPYVGGGISTALLAP